MKEHDPADLAGLGDQSSPEGRLEHVAATA
jgi:hypothetical protein